MKTCLSKISIKDDTQCSSNLFITVIYDIHLNIFKYYFFKQAIDVLLAFLADPSLVLTHGVGSALCAAASTEYEYRRPINTRLALVSINHDKRCLLFHIKTLIDNILVFLCCFLISCNFIFSQKTVFEMWKNTVVAYKFFNAKIENKFIYVDMVSFMAICCPLLYNTFISYFIF
jgi:hypothetical protein